MGPPLRGFLITVKEGTVVLTVTVACVGKLKETYWRDACAEYAKRLSAFCRLNVVEVVEEWLFDNLLVV